MPQINTATLFDITFTSAPRFSPCGERAAFIAAVADKEKNTYLSNIWVISGTNAAQLTRGGDARAFCWTPEGTLLFSAARTDSEKAAAKSGERITHFYEISPDGGEAAHAFALPYAAGGLRHIQGSIYAFTDSFDEAYPSLDGLDADKKQDALEKWSAPAYRAVTGVPFRFNGRGWTEGKYTRLCVFDRASGESYAVTPEGLAAGSYTYADGKLYYVASPARSAESRGTDGIYSFDLRSRRTAVLLAPDGLTELGFIEAREDGLLLVSANKGERYGLNETEGLYVLGPTASGALRPIADTPVCYAPGAAGSDARLGGGQTCKMLGNDLVYTALSRYSTELRRVGADGSVSVMAHSECIDSFDISGDGSVLACEFRGGRPAEIYLDGVQITHFNDFLADTPKPMHFTFNASDGCELDGWVLRPADYAPGIKKYPALLEIHGGPRTAYGETFFHEMQVFAGAGYFVFFCNPRGSDGRGDEFADIWGGYGERDYLDLMEFCDAALAREPDADPERLGVLGGSYGGYMTNWMIGHTRRFAAACSQRSIADWTMFEHSSDIGGIFTEAQHKAVTDSNRDYLWYISPLKYAKNAVTPTLFIHSDEDWRCPLSEGVAMYSALVRGGVPARLCVFHGENHELSRSGKPQNRISRLSEMLDWFDKYLKAENN